MKKIKTFSLTKLLASTSVEFHSVILGILMTFRDVIPQIQSLLERYQDAIKSQQLGGRYAERVSKSPLGDLGVN